MNSETLTWPPESICITSTTLDVRSIAAEIYGRVCRSTFDAPGFCLLDVGRSIDTIRFRQLMVQLKGEMAGIHQRVAGKTLCYLSAARFDQQETTRPHLDAGPKEFLVKHNPMYRSGCEMLRPYTPVVRRRGYDKLHLQDDS